MSISKATLPHLSILTVEELRPRKSNSLQTLEDILTDVGIHLSRLTLYLSAAINTGVSHRLSAIVREFYHDEGGFDMDTGPEV